MRSQIQLLDCTLRDGAYIVDSMFGEAAIKGIITKMGDANIDIIECGWLKDRKYEAGSTFFHIPEDIRSYLGKKNQNSIFVAMIDWNRYDLSQLPSYDGETIDAIRVVFPREHFREGVEFGKIICDKGYRVFFQAADTLAYSDSELIELAKEVNRVKPEALSIVDTFGAMYGSDLEHIVGILDEHITDEIKLGFHSHNNQQMSFANSMQFAKLLEKCNRNGIIDSSLCGMGRGAGNAATELVANYLNRKHHGNYDLNTILDAIDMYMGYFQANYRWGYSTPYFIAGIYCTHVNNIAYLLNNHRANAKDMNNIIGAMSLEDRRHYDYDLLENKYLEYCSQSINDEEAVKTVAEDIGGRPVLLILPGKSVIEQYDKIQKYIIAEEPVVIGVNAIIKGYDYSYLFFGNHTRYDYAKEIHQKQFKENKKIISSNIKVVAQENEWIVNFNQLIKRGWEHFDNSGLMCLRLMNRLRVQKVLIAGFDGFGNSYEESYADLSLPHINPGKKWEELNEEIRDMLEDFRIMTEGRMEIRFLTASAYE